MWSDYQGRPYITDLVCTIQLSTFDTLCAETGPNSPRNWPPVVSLFNRYDAGASSGRLTCNAWDHSANAFGSGWNSVTGCSTIGARFLAAGMSYAWTLHWLPPTIPNSSGIGVQYFPTPVVNCKRPYAVGQATLTYDRVRSPVARWDGQDRSRVSEGSRASAAAQGLMRNSLIATPAFEESG